MSECGQSYTTALLDRLVIYAGRNRGDLFIKECFISLCMNGGLISNVNNKSLVLNKSLVDRMQLHILLKTPLLYCGQFTSSWVASFFTELEKYSL